MKPMTPVIAPAVCRTIAADRKGEQTEHGEVQAGSDHGAQHAGIAERHRRVAVQDRGADEERREGDDLANRRTPPRANTIALAASIGARAGHGQQAGANHAGGVLRC